MPRSAETWERRMEQTIREHSSKHISAKTLATWEKGVAGRVPVKDFRAWMAKAVERLSLTVPEDARKTLKESNARTRDLYS